MKLRILLWNLQKVLHRFFYNIFKGPISFDARSRNSKLIAPLVNTKEFVGLANYKNTKGAEYRRILKIKNSILNPKTGVIWLNREMLEQSSCWDTRKLEKWEPRPYLAKNIYGVYTFLPDNGYFHFLIEDLPRFIESIQVIKNSVTLIGSNSNYVIKSLDVLNQSKFEIKKSPAKVECLILSEKINGRLFSKKDLHLLRTSFSSYIYPSINDSIFISRKDLSGKKFESRGIEKRNEIENIFKNYGFKVIYLEDLSFLDQITTISRAKNIAGFHGAGLSNIVWAEDANVIEITKNRKTQHFEHISKICKHRYDMFSTNLSVKYLHQKIIKSFS